MHMSGARGTDISSASKRDLSGAGGDRAAVHTSAVQSATPLPGEIGSTWELFAVVFIVNLHCRLGQEKAPDIRAPGGGR